MGEDQRYIDGGKSTRKPYRVINDVSYGKPHYSYDKTGKRIDDTLNVNAALPEIIITPDSTKSPGERAVLERERRRNYDRVNGKGTYNAVLDTEQIEANKRKSDKDFENSWQHKAAEYTQAAMQGIGMGADVVSRIPMYSTLKGTNLLGRRDWLNPDVFKIMLPTTLVGAALYNNTSTTPEMKANGGILNKQYLK